MADPKLIQVQNLIDHLSPLDQVRLMEYISARIEKIISTMSTPEIITSDEGEKAWSDFFRIGGEIMKSDVPKSATLTSTLLSMRR